MCSIARTVGKCCCCNATLAEATSIDKQRVIQGSAEENKSSKATDLGVPQFCAPSITTPMRLYCDGLFVSCRKLDRGAVHKESGILQLAKDHLASLQTAVACAKRSSILACMREATTLTVRRVRRGENLDRRDRSS
jgi:hypothetical protein